jgi:HD superfamily phosphohydrolase YqeK
MKPWKAFADAMEESQRRDEIERTADCTQRHLYELIHKHAFAEVREILQHTKEYMEETIEVLEEEKEQPSGFRATPHRHSA